MAMTTYAAATGYVTPEQEVKPVSDKFLALLGISREQSLLVEDEIIKFRQEIDSLRVSSDAEKVKMVKNLVALTKKCVTDEFRLVLIRGIPGSGKSTYARQIQSIFKIVHGIDANVEEADIYMGSPFDGKRLQECHNLCKANTRKALQSGGYVIVSNTFTTRVELRPYEEMSKALITEPPTSWKYDVDICMKKCSKIGIPRHIYSRGLDNIKQGK